MGGTDDRAALRKRQLGCSEHRLAHFGDGEAAIHVPGSVRVRVRRREKLGDLPLNLPGPRDMPSIDNTYGWLSVIGAGGVCFPCRSPLAI